MFVIDLLSPKNLLKYSTLGCLLSALILVAKGAESAFLLYTAATIFGFCISSQFGAAYSWSAENMDVVASLSLFQSV